MPFRRTSSLPWYKVPGLHSGYVFGKPGTRQTWPTEKTFQGHGSAEKQSSAKKLSRGLGTHLSVGKIANLGIQRSFSAKTGAELPCT